MARGAAAVAAAAMWQHPWWECPWNMPPLEERERAVELLRGVCGDSAGAVEVDYHAHYLELYPDEPWHYLPLLRRSLNIPGADDMILDYYLPPASPPRRPRRASGSRRSGSRRRAPPPQPQLQPRPPPNPPLPPEAPPKSRRRRPVSAAPDTFVAVDAGARGDRADRALRKRARLSRGDSRAASVWEPCGETLARAAYVARGATVCVVPAREGSARTAVVVDERFVYSVGEAASSPYRHILAQAYEDANLIDDYIKIASTPPYQGLVVALRPATGPGDDDSAPLAVALLSSKCKNGHPGCCCEHLGLWAIVTPVEKQRQGHARRCAAAIRAHAAHHGADHVHAFLQNRGESGAFFAKLGFKRSTPNTVVPSTVGFMNILAAEAPSPYADSDSDDASSESSAVSTGGSV